MRDSGKNHGKSRIEIKLNAELKMTQRDFESLKIDHSHLATSFQEMQQNLRQKDLQLRDIEK